METRLRYALTSDGVAIAFWAYGAGATLLHLPWLPWGHVELESREPEFQTWYDQLAAFCHLVRYDGRGSGLRPGGA